MSAAIATSTFEIVERANNHDVRFVARCVCGVQHEVLVSKRAVETLRETTKRNLTATMSRHQCRPRRADRWGR